MNSEIIIKQFDAIETKVNEVLNTLKNCKSENAELKQQIKRLEETLRQKEEAENHFAEEKRQIRGKIDGLLGKLNNLTNQDSN